MSPDEEDEGEAVELPLMSFDDEESEPLPTFGMDDEEKKDEVDSGVTDFSIGSDEAREEAVEEAVADAAADDTLESVQAEIEQAPDDVALHQREVELAYQGGDESQLVEAYLGLAEALDRTGQGTFAAGAYRQVIDLDPSNKKANAALGDRAPGTQPVKEVASHEEYVDLGSLLLGDEPEKSTRMTVAYEEPSGDETADFVKMLSQFKEKVSENLDADDVRAHHDLGTAYKEMGLLDEAIAEFQQALRADSTHLPTYEVLGQTFMEMGQSDAAVRSLQRALSIDYDVEDELLGIYYYLARAYEDLGNIESAVEFYDRVFSLDINFADVTERLRALR
jgi:tetratricopeptide (TPR) repeat protein